MVSPSLFLISQSMASMWFGLIGGIIMGVFNLYVSVCLGECVHDRRLCKLFLIFNLWRNLDIRQLCGYYSNLFCSLLVSSHDFSEPLMNRWKKCSHLKYVKGSVLKNKRKKGHLLPLFFHLMKCKFTSIRMLGWIIALIQFDCYGCTPFSIRPAIGSAQFMKIKHSVNSSTDRTSKVSLALESICPFIPSF